MSDSIRNALDFARARVLFAAPALGGLACALVPAPAQNQRDLPVPLSTDGVTLHYNVVNLAFCSDDDLLRDLVAVLTLAGLGISTENGIDGKTADDGVDVEEARRLMDDMAPGIGPFRGGHFNALVNAAGPEVVMRNRRLLADGLQAAVRQQPQTRGRLEEAITTVERLLARSAEVPRGAWTPPSQSALHAKARGGELAATEQLAFANQWAEEILRAAPNDEASSLKERHLASFFEALRAHVNPMVAIHVTRPLLSDPSRPIPDAFKKSEPFRTYAAWVWPLAKRVAEHEKARHEKAEREKAEREKVPAMPVAGSEIYAANNAMNQALLKVVFQAPALGGLACVMRAAQSNLADHLGASRQVENPLLVIDGLSLFYSRETILSSSPAEIYRQVALALTIAGFGMPGDETPDVDLALRAMPILAGQSVDRPRVVVNKPPFEDEARRITARNLGCFIEGLAERLDAKPRLNADVGGILTEATRRVSPEMERFLRPSMVKFLRNGNRTVLLGDRETVISLRADLASNPIDGAKQYLLATQWIAQIKAKPCGTEQEQERVLHHLQTLFWALTHRFDTVPAVYAARSLIAARGASRFRLPSAFLNGPEWRAFCDKYRDLILEA